MSAMILLGIFIAGMILNLKDNAQGLNGSLITAIDSIQMKAGESAGGEQ